MLSGLATQARKERQVPSRAPSTYAASSISEWDLDIDELLPVQGDKDTAAAPASTATAATAASQALPSDHPSALQSSLSPSFQLKASTAHSDHTHSTEPLEQSVFGHQRDSLQAEYQHLVQQADALKLSTPNAQAGRLVQPDTSVTAKVSEPPCSSLPDQSHASPTLLPAASPDSPTTFLNLRALRSIPTTPKSTNAPPSLDNVGLRYPPDLPSTPHHERLLHSYSPKAGQPKPEAGDGEAAVPTTPLAAVQLPAQPGHHGHTAEQAPVHMAEQQSFQSHQPGSDGRAAISNDNSLQHDALEREALPGTKAGIAFLDSPTGQSPGHAPLRHDSQHASILYHDRQDVEHGSHPSQQAELGLGHGCSQASNAAGTSQACLSQRC